MALTTTGQEIDLQATGLGVKLEQFVSKIVNRDGIYGMNVVTYSRGAFDAWKQVIAPHLTVDVLWCSTSSQILLRTSYAIST